MPSKRPHRLLVALFAMAMVWTLGVGTATAKPQGQVGMIPDVGTACLTVLTNEVPSGVRVGSGRQALQLSFGSGDLVFLEGDGAGRLGVGESLEVVRVAGEARHPRDNSSIGLVLEILGVLEVVDVSATSGNALGRLVGACREVEVGDYLRPMSTETLAEIPEVPPFDVAQLVEPSESDATVVLGSVESVVNVENRERQGLTHRADYFQNDVVAIDQGSAGGWSPGDFGLIYREVMPSEYRSPGLSQPPLVLARGLAVRVTATDALLLITDGDFPVERGHRVKNVGPVTVPTSSRGAVVAGNRPPTISCRAERSRVRQGESIRLTATASDPDGDATRITWTPSAGSVSPSEGASVTWSASGVQPGTVFVTARADDGSGGQATCSIDVGVDAPPPTAEARSLTFLCQEFPAGSSVVDNRCKAVLDDVALQLRQNPRATVRLVGHSDPSGAADVNERMSTERASNAGTYLIETHGIDAARISTEGMGSSQLLPGATAAQQRRVEIAVTIPAQ